MFLWFSKWKKQIQTNNKKKPEPNLSFYKLKKPALGRLFSKTQHPYLFSFLGGAGCCWGIGNDYPLGEWSPCFMKLLKTDLCLSGIMEITSVSAAVSMSYLEDAGIGWILTLWGQLFSWFKSWKESSNKLRVWKGKEECILWEQGNSLCYADAFLCQRKVW